VQEAIGEIDGEPSLIDQTVIFRQTERSASAIVAYPFNRARRVEFQRGSDPALVRPDRSDAGFFPEHR